ncbi:MAG: proton-conducting transporter membrane subunit [Alicyclobacillaceae bacterium]|uniref:proton-conducting transporter transmembrane domain-containing protein n=1 Tax=Alicyclobacillus sp. SP_1 TaxID=2942475 RepID=UPI00215776F7|nr:proton-conducting transporter membrane subunit [Alicyclobacillus sp. SP_1]MCY0888163.1 proton-conducting transporter membrane subunit [Alicyclobacillaceae bacterium]
MFASGALGVDVLCMAVFLLASLVALCWQKAVWVGHSAGMLASAGLAVAGLFGLLQPQLHKTQAQLMVRSSIHSFTSIVYRTNPLSDFFLLLIGSVGLLVSLYGVGYVREYRQEKGAVSVSLLLAGVLAFLASMASVVLAGDVFTFLVSWESMSILSFFLVMYEHERSEIQRAGFIYVVMTHLGTVFLTVGFFVMAHYAHSYQFSEFSKLDMPTTAKSLVLLMMLVGFGTKAGLIPFHIWLPRAHPVAPSHVSALMSGVMIKTALYGFLMVVFLFFGVGQIPLWWGMVVAAIGVPSAVLGILYALLQHEQKRMLAYSSIENMGLLFMGVGVSMLLFSLHQPDFAAFALLAVLVHSLNHALFKSLSFLSAGSVLASTHTQNLNLLGGLMRKMPWTAVFALIAALSISSMPPLNGFVGEWMLFQSFVMLAIIRASLWVHIVAILLLFALTGTGALVAMAFVRSFGMTFLGMPRSEAVTNAKEVSWTMRIGMGALALACVLLGVYPFWLLRLLEPSIRLLTLVDPVGVSPSIGMNNISWLTMIPAPIHSTIGNFEPLSIVLALLVMALLSLWLFRRYGNRASGKKARTVGPVWSGGMTVDGRMAYTASGYSKPVRIAFQQLFRTSRQLSVTEGDEHFPKRLLYVHRIPPFAETYLYRPLVSALLVAANVIRKVQNGQVQSYMAYLFLTLLFVLFLVR